MPGKWCRLESRLVSMSAVRALLVLVLVGAIAVGPGAVASPGDDEGGVLRATEAETTSASDEALATNEWAKVDTPPQSFALRKRPPRLGRIVPPLPERLVPKIAPVRRVTMAFSGDMIPHGAVTRQAQANAGGSGYDYLPMLEHIAPFIERADLAICHLESPLSATSSNLSGYPQFNAPRELAEGVAAIGYDGCSLASNHSFDRRESGVIETVDVMEDSGLGSAGMSRTPDEAADPQIYQANGISVAHLSFTYSLNGFRLPAGKDYLVDLIDPDVIEQRAAEARSAGAQIVVVSMHWGDEYRSTPSRYQDDLANRLMAHPDIDLIVGHHAHVVQPIEKRGRANDPGVVVFGMGNFLSNQSSACCITATQDGVIVMVTFTETKRGQFEFTSGCIEPTWVDRSDYTILPASGPDRAAPEASVARTRSTMGSAGAFDQGFASTCAR